MFSGIGGIELGLMRSGLVSKVAWQIDTDEYCTDVLKKQFPDSLVMNKKVEDIKVEKITDEQLQELQGHVNTINNAQLQLGQLESQKHTLVNAIPQLQKGLKEFQDKMEEEYGKVSINIQDGTIQEIPEDEQANT